MIPEIVTQNGTVFLTDTERNEKIGELFTDGFEFSYSESTDNEKRFFYKKGKINLKIVYTVKNGALEEVAEIGNGGCEAYRPDSFIFGFIRKNPGSLRFCAIPFRRRSEDGELMDWNSEEYMSKKHIFCTMRNPIYNRRETDTETAEGFAFYGRDGHTLVVSKYSPRTIEYSLAKADGQGIKFGGCGIGRMGDPEGGACVLPGKKYKFAVTRYSLCEGGFKEAYYVHRDFLISKGHKSPENYAPRLTWNELYDNRYWYESHEATQNVPELLKKYYNRADIMQAAERAHEFGCEMLYLDPGWDTSFGSNIWDESRMGKMDDFAEEIKEKYGLTLGLHTPLAPWGDTSEYQEDERKKSGDGKREGFLCVMSKQYHDTKIERLAKLCENGAVFLLYDGSWYENPCFDENHGHSVPSTRQEHIEAINKLAHSLHEKYPDVTIEQHDSIIGPGCPRYLPLYCNMMPGSGDHDENWAFEFMNDPLEDFKSGRAYSMYYANLGSAVPFYLHIDLRYDNENCLSFWWFASTCRHIGIGGTCVDGEKLAKQKAEVKTYIQNGEFYKNGKFFGIDELIHAHVIGNSAVIDFFNPSCEEKNVNVTIKPQDLGIAYGSTKNISVKIPAAGHSWVKIKL